MTKIFATIWVIFNRTFSLVKKLRNKRFNRYIFFKLVQKLLCSVRENILKKKKKKPMITSWCDIDTTYFHIPGGPDLFLLTCSHYLLLGGSNKPKPPAGSDAPASLHEELHSVGRLWGQWAPAHEPWPPCWPLHLLPHYTNQNCLTLVRYTDYTHMQLHSLIYLHVKPEWWATQTKDFVQNNPFALFFSTHFSFDLYSLLYKY